MKRVMVRACSVAIALLTVLLAVAGANGRKKTNQTPEDTVLGTVSCTVAAPRPPAGATQTPPDSVQLCLDRHGVIVVIQEPRDEAIPIDNPETLKGYEGRRVSVSGYKNGDNFHIISVRII